MKGYGSFCPVAKASEVLTERWTLLVMRELLLGSRRFNDLRRGLPPMSPTLISKRLQTLQASGVIERVDVAGRSGSEYRLTRAGEELRPIIEAIGHWGQRWVRSDLSPDELDAGALMWYIHRHFRVDKMPASRVVMHLELTDEKHLKHWWLVLHAPDVELCVDDPGFDVDIEMAVDLRSLTQIYIGDLSMQEALARHRVRARGSEHLLRDLPLWFARSKFADDNPRREPPVLPTGLSTAQQRDLPSLPIDSPVPMVEF
jgi:DNA-binding HxlR family transcriptional regulator